MRPPNVNHPSVDGTAHRRPALPSVFGPVTVAFLLAVAWGPTLARMWLRWFPAWRAPGLSLMQRLTQGDSYYTHGPLVLLVGVVIVVATYRRRGVPTGRTRTATMIGWALFVASCLVHLVSLHARVAFTSGFALVGVLGGLLLIGGGWPLAKTYGPAVAMLLLSVPLPMNWIAELNFALKTHAGSAAAWLTCEVMGIPVVIDGSYVHLLPDPGGQPKTLVIENLCSGLRSLIALVWFATMFVFVCRTRGRLRIWLVLAAPPAAVGCNILRIAALNLAAHHLGTRAAGPTGLLHDLTALGMFALALAFQFALDRVLSLTQRPGRPQTAPGPAPRPAPTGRLAPLTVASATALTLVCGLSVLVSATRPAGPRCMSRLARQAAPTVLTLDGLHLTGRDMRLDSRTLTELETTDYLYRRYAGKDAGPYVDLLIVFAGDNRKGAHPPEVCLAGRGGHIVANGRHRLDDAGLEMREIVAERAGRRSCHLYVYKCGRMYTTSFLTQQAAVFGAGLIGNNAGGALIRLTVPVGRRDIPGARRLALAAARALMPRIDRALP